MYEKKFRYVSKVGLQCKCLLSVAYIFKRALSFLHLLFFPSSFLIFLEPQWLTHMLSASCSEIRKLQIADAQSWFRPAPLRCYVSVSSDFFFCIFCVLSQVFTKWTSDTAMEVFSLGFIPVTWLLLFLSGASCFSFALLFLFCLDSRICSAP